MKPLQDSDGKMGDLMTAVEEHALVLATDPHGRITRANDRFCALARLSPDDLLQHDHRLIDATCHSAAFLEGFWTTLTQGRAWQGEIRNLTPGGANYWIAATVVSQRDTSGSIRACQVFGADITACKQAEATARAARAQAEKRLVERTAQLQVAHEELESFSSTVSHDLRAPLHTLDEIAFAILVDFGPLLPPREVRHLAAIRNGAQRMGELIDDLLDYARACRQQLVRRRVDVGVLVHELIEETRAHQRGRAVEFRVGDLPACKGDDALLRQLWKNLLSNALKFTGKTDQPIVEIGCRCVEENIYFVRDNGVGFDMQFAGKLFGAFHRLHRPEYFAGTGVGLAIVQRIVTRHGGRIWAEAELNRGATFYFTLSGSLET